MICLDLHLERPGFSLQASLHLPSHGVTALFGPSGCGKTTLLRALAGLERASGRVLVDGEVWQDDARGLFVPTHRRALGYVIQEAALFPHLDVRRNLAYGQRRAGPGRIRLDEVVQLLGIGHLMDRRPATLSGGERQRVAIARALAASPRLLLMDEPLAALDAARKAEVLPYLEGLQQALGLPVVYVSHAVEEVARLADHLVLLQQGRVLASGPVADILARVEQPLPLGDEAGVVLAARIADRDAHWQLARIEAQDGPCSFWARDPGRPTGQAVRLRVLARDVSLTRERQSGTSIGNQLPVVVEAVGADAHPGLALVRVRCGQAPLLARVTRRSAESLDLAPGLPVWAQVKTVALME